MFHVKVPSGFYYNPKLKCTQSILGVKGCVTHQTPVPNSTLSSRKQLHAGVHVWLPPWFWTHTGPRGYPNSSSFTSNINYCKVSSYTVHVDEGGIAMQGPSIIRRLSQSLNLEYLFFLIPNFSFS